MIERYSTTLRNTRKHFVKCVDCCCRTLSQNAAKDDPWVAAATLSISGRVNDGALCFKCANERRRLLGLPLVAAASKERTPARPALANDTAAQCQTALRKIRINNREYQWVIGSLESLVTKWCAETFPMVTKSQDKRFLLVAVNNVRILEGDFGSMPIADGDEISILVGGKF